MSVSLCVCPFVRLNHSGLPWTDTPFDNGGHENLSKKIQLSLKQEYNIGHFTSVGSIVAEQINSP